MCVGVRVYMCVDPACVCTCVWVYVYVCMFSGSGGMCVCCESVWWVEAC